MEYSLGLKKVEINYSAYCKKVRVKCPFCQYDAHHHTRVFKSLKRLIYHLSVEHSKESMKYYPFTIDDIRNLMKSVAMALDFRLLA